MMGKKLRVLRSAQIKKKPVKYRLLPSSIPTPIQVNVLSYFLIVTDYFFSLFLPVFSSPPLCCLSLYFSLTCYLSQPSVSHLYSINLNMKPALSLVLSACATTLISMPHLQRFISFVVLAFQSHSS